MRHIVLLIPLLLSFYNGATQTPISFDFVKNETVEAWPSCTFIEQEGEPITIEDLLAGKYNSKMVEAHGTPSTFGFTSSVIWVKFIVDAPRKNAPLFLTLERVSLWSAELYSIRSDGTYEVDHLGVNFPFTHRGIQTKFGVTQLEFDAAEASRTYYLKVEAVTSLFLPLYLDSSKTLIRKISSTDLFNGIYVGVLIVIMLYNLIAFALRRQRIYLFYLFYVFALFIYQGLFNTGLGFEYIWSNSPLVNRHYTVAASMLGISMILFSAEFLNTKVLFPSQRLWPGLLVTGFALIIILNLVGFVNFTSKYLVWLQLPAFVYLLALGVYSLSKGNLNARFYVAGWGVFIIFYLFFTLWLNGFIGDSELAHRSLFIGSFLEMIMWFTAISDKINLSRIETSARELRLRKEIGRDFHDELGNEAARLINYVGLLKINKKIDDDIYRPLNHFAQNLLHGAKDFVWTMEPGNDDIEAVVIHLRDFGERMFSEREISFRFFGDLSKIELPKGHSRQINLIFKEAMTNAFRHSEATSVTFKVNTRPKGELEIELSDDGRGVNEETINSSQRGFENMRVRASKIKSTLTVVAGKNGTSVKLIIGLS